MKTLLLATAAALALSGAAHAGTVRFCGADGPYGEVAKKVAEFSTETLKIEVDNTSSGTTQNLRRLLLPKGDPKGCDAVIGQPDGEVYLRKNPGFFGATAGDAGSVRRVVSFHREKVQIACARPLDLQNIYYTKDKGKLSVALGPEGSGAWLFWQNAIAADAGYDKPQVVQAGGIDALSQVANGGASCFLRISGVPDDVMRDADQLFGGDLQMVEANDKALVATKGLDGNPIYQWDRIDRKSYPKLLEWASYVNTVSELAGGYVNVRKVDRADLDQLIRAMANAAKWARGTYGE